MRAPRDIRAEAPTRRTAGGRQRAFAPAPGWARLLASYGDSSPEQRPWLLVRGELAHGGMGRIHKVFDRRLRRHVAMKVLANREASRESFVEEAQITGQLDHPNIPPVHELWLDDGGHLCFSMKLVRGQTLGHWVRRQRPAQRTDAELARLLQVLLKVCDAMAFAHSRGVIHRDLKPANIMVGDHGQVYVMDWGCAFVRSGPQRKAQRVSLERSPLRQAPDATDVALGTVSYMAPEQACAKAHQIDERTDVYQLGGVLYAILTGRPPHADPDVQRALRSAQRGEVPHPQQVVGGARLPPELCRIALKALQPKRAERYRSVTKLREALERAQQEGWWFESMSWPAGALVLREGEKADAAYIITKGWCLAFRNVNGRRVALRRMGPGDTFGETAIFTARRRSASIEVLETMTATVVRREALEQSLRGKSWLGPFVRALAERFYEVDVRLAKLRSRKQAAQRPRAKRPR